MAACRFLLRTCVKPRQLLQKLTAMTCSSRLEEAVLSSNILVQQIRLKKGGHVKLRLPPEAKEKVYMGKKKNVIEYDPSKDPDVKYAGRVPTDDVWIRSFYPRPRYSLLETINMHREAAVPEMLDSWDAIVYLNCTLDFRTKKKTKFMQGIQNTVVLPHNFDDGMDHRVMVFAKTPEDKEIAKNMGAEYYGSVDLIKSIEGGHIKPDDYDHVVCTVDMLTEIGAVRKALKDRFPTKQKKNTIGGDVAGMVKFFQEGKTYESYKTEEAVGKVEVPFGTLDMKDEQLIENYGAVLEALASHRSANLGQFITKCTVECPPSDEEYLIKEHELIPASQRKKKVVKLVQEEEPVVQAEESDDESEKITAKN